MVCNVSVGDGSVPVLTRRSSIKISETESFSHQVAGHDGLLVAYDPPRRTTSSSAESTQHGEERDSDCDRRALRRLLKPLMGDARGAAEKEFYERVFRSERADVELQRFLPEYFGCIEVLGKGDYMKLADLTASFEHPCVADIKIGRQTYDPDATPEKNERETSKYPQMSEMGFKICGMKIFDPKERASVTFDRTYGLSVTKENAADALATYLNLREDEPSTHSPKPTAKDARACILDAFNARLADICAYMRAQRSFRFFCTSLLFVYDGADLLAPPDADRAPRVGVYMIDFGHVFPADSGDAPADPGYVYGVERLRETFSEARGRYIAA